jgi:hypothetical protein
MNTVESGAVNALDPCLEVEELFIELFLLFSLLISAYLFLLGLAFEQIVTVSFFFEAVVTDGVKVASLCAPVS